MSLLESLKRNDRQLIFLVVLVLSIFPAFQPLGIPLPTYDLTTRAYQAIETLKSGELVLVSFDFGPAVWVEMGPPMKAMLQHLFIKRVRMVIVSFEETGAGPPMAERALREIDLRGAKYGVDYVNLGFIPGLETGMAAFVENPRRYTHDFYGTPVERFEIMKDIKSIKDFKLYIFACYTWVDPWMRQFHGRVPQIIGVLSADAIPLVMPWIEAKQLYTAVRGMRGGAEYEALIKRPSEATSYMDAASLTLTFGLLLVFVANYSYLRKRFSRGGGS